VRAAEPLAGVDVLLGAQPSEAGGHAARGVEVPGVGAHVGLGPDDALAERARRGVDPGHPVGEQQGRTWHPGLVHVGVLDGEHRPEQVGDPARSEVLELGAVEARSRVPGRRRPDRRHSLAGSRRDQLRGLGASGQEAGVRGGLEVQVTFDECGTNGNSHVYNCMYISGGGLSATETYCAIV
jgi:hypothetical protein